MMTVSHIKVLIFNMLSCLTHGHYFIINEDPNSKFTLNIKKITVSDDCPRKSGVGFLSAGNYDV
jgi:hypothetical protein